MFLSRLYIQRSIYFYVSIRGLRTCTVIVEDPIEFRQGVGRKRLCQLKKYRNIDYEQLVRLTQDRAAYTLVITKHHHGHPPEVECVEPITPFYVKLGIKLKLKECHRAF